MSAGSGAIVPPDPDDPGGEDPSGCDAPGSPGSGIVAPGTWGTVGFEGPLEHAVTTKTTSIGTAMARRRAPG
jgi:hypothetical protein